MTTCEGFQVCIQHKSMSLSQNPRSHPYSALIPSERSKRSLREFLFLQRTSVSLIDKKQQIKATNTHKLSIEMKLHKETMANRLWNIFPSSVFAVENIKSEKMLGVDGKTWKLLWKEDGKIFFMSVVFIFPTSAVPRPSPSRCTELGQVFFCNGEPAKETWTIIRDAMNYWRTTTINGTEGWRWEKKDFYRWNKIIL